jgi:hypothetical protein
LLGFALRRGALICLALGGGLLLRRLLCGELLRSLLLLCLLLLLAFLLELRLALCLLLRGQLLLLGALGQPGLRVRNRGLQPRQRRMLRVGLLDQRIQPLCLDEILAVAALLGGDHRHRHQVGQRAGNPGVAGLFVAQREVVLHRVVAARRVELALRVRGARLLAQLLGAECGDLGGHGGGWRCDRLARRGCGGLVGGGGLFLLACRQGAEQRCTKREPGEGRRQGRGRTWC